MKTPDQGRPGDQCVPARGRLGAWSPRGSEPTSTHVVPPSEGNEVRREGRQGVGASHSTVETGEFRPAGDPVEGRGCRTMGPSEGKMAETLGSSTIYT